MIIYTIFLKKKYSKQPTINKNNKEYNIILNNLLYF